MVDYQHIKYDFTDGIAKIILNRPPLNVLNIEMMKEINKVLELLLDENSLKLVVFSAEGKAFSAGVDVSEHLGEQVNEMVKVFHGIFRLLIKLNKPTLAVVDGACLGGGCELAAFCDLVIASENSRFGQPEIQVGVFPPIACLILPKIISNKKAMELLLTGSAIKADEAEKVGLINKCIPSDKLQEESDKLIQKFKDLSASVLSYTRKAALNRFNKEFLDYLDEVEDFYLNQLMKTEDAQEGLKAFLEKRKPEWHNK
ncbi:MAG: enoyl-CoA hydratase/isomerase family protein [Planctomycetota bacterium]